MKFTTNINIKISQFFNKLTDKTSNNHIVIEYDNTITLLSYDKKVVIVNYNNNTVTIKKSMTQTTERNTKQFLIQEFTNDFIDMNDLKIQDFTIVYK